MKRSRDSTILHKTLKGLLKAQSASLTARERLALEYPAPVAKLIFQTERHVDECANANLLFYAMGHSIGDTVLHSGAVIACRACLKSWRVEARYTQQVADWWWADAN